MAGFSQGGGVGLALANWMTTGDPGFDIWGMDVARFGDWTTLAYTNVKVREDGRVMHMNYLWQVKPVAKAKYKYDFCEQLATVQPEDAWRPLSEGGCPLIKT